MYFCTNYRQLVLKFKKKWNLGFPHLTVQIQPMSKSANETTPVRKYENRHLVLKTDALIHTAKTLYRKFGTNIRRNETARSRSQYLHHVSVSDLYIHTIDLPILLQEDTWIWKLVLRPRCFFSGNLKIGFSLHCRSLVHINYTKLAMPVCGGNLRTNNTVQRYIDTHRVDKPFLIFFW
jgi:hypothetical protein